MRKAQLAGATRGRLYTRGHRRDQAKDLRMQHRTVWVLVVCALLCVASGTGGCDDEGGGGTQGDGTTTTSDGTSGSTSGSTSGLEDVSTIPTPVEPGEWTYRLDESTSGAALWTSPVAYKPLASDRAPTESNSGLNLSAARREFEPVQLVIDPGAASEATVSIDPFPNLGSTQRLNLSVARYQDGWPDVLEPFSSGGTITLNANEPSPIWLTARIPDDAPAGEHTTTLHLQLDGGPTINIPVTLTVFDFALPQEIGFHSMFDMAIEPLIPAGGSVDDAKTLLFEHRFTPKAATWPSGFTWRITWNSDANPSRCTTFWDEPTEQDQYSIRALARRYMLGEGWNGTGFPLSQAFQFIDNSTPRPDTFCNVSRGSTHEGSAEYNAEWSKFLGAFDAYIVANNLQDRLYYYIQNEPQDDADAALANHLCRLTRAAAPNLKIAISEEPTPAIAERPEGSCGYDIWIAHVRALQPDYALTRQRLGESLWIYSLDQDPDPYFNPTRLDRQGLHARIIPWTAWALRAEGWAYYDTARFFPDGQPNIRAALLREGFEDYEYLLLANGGARPVAGEPALADATALSVASSLTSWTQNPDALASLRHALGRYIEGSATALPILQATSSRPRDAYYLNFQDPSGQPAADPLVVDGKTWLKIGWGAYDAALGYGWSGENIADPGIALYGYDEADDANELQRSYVFDDYGRDNLFTFDLSPGRYRVTVGAGRPAKGYPGDPHNITVEGQPLLVDHITTDAEPTVTRSVDVDINDGNLSLIVGGRSQVTGGYAYTFLGFVSVEPIE